MLRLKGTDGDSRDRCIHVVQSDGCKRHLFYIAIDIQFWYLDPVANVEEMMHAQMDEGGYSLDPVLEYPAKDGADDADGCCNPGVVPYVKYQDDPDDPKTESSQDDDLAGCDAIIVPVKAEHIRRVLAYFND